MTPWLLRYSMRMLGLLGAMLVIEYVAYLLARESGVSRIYWVAPSFGIVALAGYDTVTRLPLIWGALVGGALAATVNVISWAVGALVLEGRFHFPDDAEPVLVLTSLLIALIVGAIVGGVAGAFARTRRRKRQRRSALNSLAYTAFDEPVAPREASRDSA